MSTFKQIKKFWKVTKQTLEVTNLAKGQWEIYTPENIFRKGHVVKLIKSLSNLIYQKLSSM